MNFAAFLECSPRRFLPVVLASMVGVLAFVSGVEAKTKRLDDKTLQMAVDLAKDREAAFAREEAMSTEAFEARWTAFAAHLNELYGEHEVRLRKFGTDVRFRKGFTHLLYMAFRVQTRGTLLSPSAQEVVAKHTFLQELVLEGSCYTGGDSFPKKMRDLLKAQPEMQYLIRENLTAWNGKYRKQFEKVFPQVQ